MEEILKLERLKLPNATNSGAENLFQEVAAATGAEVLWEAGCKTTPLRKEPVIKIIGPAESVKKAKEMLLDKMEMMSNRVVLKMDVSHFEHPSLIGKGGKLIKKVMEATGCHIHFPDANLCSGLEKSNQVSIYGDPANVERARVMIRALIPIQIYFEIPPSSQFHPALECPTMESKFLGSFSGLFMYSAPGQNGTVIVVRCNQDVFPNQRKEIAKIMELFCCATGTNLPPVHIITDIVHHHHEYVRGSNSNNIEGIMKRTGAKISFPDFNSSRSERSSVKITGNLDCVYMAWQEIMNYLPVSVSFDVNGTRETNCEYLDFLRDCGITVYNRPKPKYHTKNVTVKGPEKFSKQMLQYRQHLLRLPSITFKPDIEDINLASVFLSTLTEYFHSSLSNAIPPSVTSIITKNIAFEAYQHITKTPVFEKSVQNNLTGLTANSVISQNPGYRPVSNKGQFNGKDGCFITDISELNDYYMLSNILAICSAQEQNEMKYLTSSQTALNDNAYRSKSHLKENTNGNRSLLANNNWIKDISMETVASSLSEMSISQSSTSTSHILEKNGLLDSCNLLMDGKDGDLVMPEDYYRKKVLAAKAMRRPIEESTQVPSSLWAGYGFSQSMPTCAMNQLHLGSCNSSSSSEDSEAWENVLLKDCLDGDIWSNKKESIFSHSNYLNILRNVPGPFDVAKDILPELLWQNGLHKYIDVFTKEEIDYQTFLLLTDHDLQTLGISHQARMRIVCLIRELQDSKRIQLHNCKPFDAAPGAERKSYIPANER